MSDKGKQIGDIPLTVVNNNIQLTFCIYHTAYYTRFFFYKNTLYIKNIGLKKSRLTGKQ